MSKPFWVALSELKGEISVFWTENMMYVNDNNDGQATTNTSLFQAYRFASLIESPNFDYTASDEEVKEFQKELLEFYEDDFSDKDKEQYIIDVWEYLDNIADDYKKLTGVTINDIDIKRMIVAYMSETDWENNCAMGFGSGTYIARVLSDHIIGDDRNKIKKCNNPLAFKLAEKYLQTDDYNLKEFAKALKEVNKYTRPKNFTEFLNQAYHITESCYLLGTSLLAEKKDFNFKILVGRINWQNDWEKPIYCCMNSDTKDIWFEANNIRSAFIYDMIIPHYMVGCDFDEIQVQLTSDNIYQLIEEYNIEETGVIGGYIHCNMYGTQGKLQDFV